MKIAILHNEMTQGNNGSERLCYLLARELGSKIYTCGYDEKVNGSYPGIEEMVVVDQIEHRDSFTRKHFEIMRSMTERNDVDADYIIYSGNQSPFRIKKDDTPYLYFCHTPERGFYDLYDQTMSRIKEWGFPRYQIAKTLFHKRKKMDLDLFKNVINGKQVVTNSELVMDRYENVYGTRPRRAVGAPIETSDYEFRDPEGYFFSAGGLRWNKRIDWQVRAVAKAGVSLKIAGDGPEMGVLEHLAKKLNADVEFMGRLDDEELRDAYSRCNAFLFSAVEEDFGMVPLEAMACGKPVISIGEGGPLEYLDASVSYLYKDIEEMARIMKNTDMADYIKQKDACIERAKEYDTKVFAQRIMEDVKGVLEEFYS